MKRSFAQKVSITHLVILIVAAIISAFLSNSKANSVSGVLEASYNYDYSFMATCTVGVGGNCTYTETKPGSLGYNGLYSRTTRHNGTSSITLGVGKVRTITTNLYVTDNDIHTSVPTL